MKYETRMFGDEQYTKCDDYEEFHEWCTEGGWDGVNDFENSTGVAFTEICGKWFHVIHNRVFIKDLSLEDSIIAQYRTLGDGITAPGRVILVEREHPHHPYVTWWHNLQSGGRCYGHYFATEQEAKDDFVQRVQRGH